MNISKTNSFAIKEYTKEELHGLDICDNCCSTLFNLPQGPFNFCDNCREIISELNIDGDEDEIDHEFYREIGGEG